MIPPSTLRLVLIVSCAHSMVHIFELALPSVEQIVATDYGVGKETTGALSTIWRLPFGFGALGAGWLVDRFGSGRMLAVYLLGCAGTSMLVGSGLPLGWLFATMFAMGLFASIYHPAGLAFISHQTSFTDRPRALGIHGVFGSAGIALAPFLAGLVLTVTSRWNTYYLVLWVPAVILGLLFIRLSWTNQGLEMRARPAVLAQDQEDDRADWRSYFALVVLAMMMGFTYSAVLSFLPRYLDGVGIRLVGIPAAGMRNYLAGSILLIGCIGQYISGRLARPAVLERQLSGVMFASAPCLLWMAYAHGWLRLWATGLFTLIHFMHQPIYNSLIAKYSPKHRRSLAYGFSFAAGMGLGSLGAIFAGNYRSDYLIYTSLAGLASIAGVWALVLARWNQNSFA